MTIVVLIMVRGRDGERGLVHIFILESHLPHPHPQNKYPNQQPCKNYPGGKDREMRQFCAVIVQFTALLLCEVLLCTTDFHRVSSTVDDEWSTKVAQAHVLWSLRQLGYNKREHGRMERWCSAEMLSSFIFSPSQLGVVGSIKRY